MPLKPSSRRCRVRYCFPPELNLSSPSHKKGFAIQRPLPLLLACRQSAMPTRPLRSGRHIRLPTGYIAQLPTPRGARSMRQRCQSPMWCLVANRAKGHRASSGRGEPPGHHGQSHHNADERPAFPGQRHRLNPACHSTRSLGVLQPSYTRPTELGDIAIRWLDRHPLLVAIGVGSEKSSRPLQTRVYHPEQELGLNDSIHRSVHRSSRFPRHNL